MDERITRDRGGRGEDQRHDQAQGRECGDQVVERVLRPGKPKMQQLARRVVDVNEQGAFGAAVIAPTPWLVKLLLALPRDVQMPASVIHLRSVSVLTAIWCHSSSFSRASVGPKSR